MHIPGFTENGYSRGFGIDQGLQVRILVNRFVEIPGAAKRCKLGVFEIVVLHCLEKFDCTGI